MDLLVEKVAIEFVLDDDHRISSFLLVELLRIP